MAEPQRNSIPRRRLLRKCGSGPVAEVRKSCYLRLDRKAGVYVGPDEPCRHARPVRNFLDRCSAVPVRHVDGTLNTDGGYDWYRVPLRGDSATVEIVVSLARGATLHAMSPADPDAARAEEVKWGRAFVGPFYGIGRECSATGAGDDAIVYRKQRARVRARVVQARKQRNLENDLLAIFGVQAFAHELAPDGTMRRAALDVGLLMAELEATSRDMSGLPLSAWKGVRWLDVLEEYIGRQCVATREDFWLNAQRGLDAYRNQAKPVENREAMVFQEDLLNRPRPKEQWPVDFGDKVSVPRWHGGSSVDPSAQPDREQPAHATEAILTAVPQPAELVAPVKAPAPTLPLWATVPWRRMVRDLLGADHPQTSLSDFVS